MGSDFWNARYDTDDYIFGTAPNVFLASQAGLILQGYTPKQIEFAPGAANRYTADLLREWFGD